MVLRRLPVVLVSAGALLAGGCGASGSKDSSKKFRGAEKVVASTVEDIQSAGRKGDAAELCNRYLATSLVKAIRTSGRRDCEATLKQSLKDVDAFDLQVVDKGVTISGPTATVKVKSDAGTGTRIDTLTMVQEPRTSGGKTTQVWKLSALKG
jgi:hypothetical protein